MRNIKFLKKRTYISICNFNFNVVIHFDVNNETLIYSLECIDNEYYDNNNYLIKYAQSFDEEKINKAIRKFMLIHIWSEIDKWIILNDYIEWKVEIIENGLKLINQITKQWVDWNIFNYDEDYEIIQNKIIKFLKQ